MNYRQIVWLRHKLPAAGESAPQQALRALLSVEANVDLGRRYAGTKMTFGEAIRPR